MAGTFNLLGNPHNPMGNTSLFDAKPFVIDLGSDIKIGTAKSYGADPTVRHEEVAFLACKWSTRFAVYPSTLALPLTPPLTP